MKYLLFCLIPLSICFACKSDSNVDPSSSQAENSPLKDSLSNILSEIQDVGQINGFAASIVSEDEVLFADGFGYANVTEGKPYTNSTVQNIASISKTLIGISLVKAQELGFLKLDDPISRHLPFEVKNPSFPASEITIRQLSTHTSSITDGDIYDEKSYVLRESRGELDSIKYFIPEEFNEPKSKMELGDFLEALLSVDGQFYSKDLFISNKPGSFFEYSNVAASLAALVVEKASGISYKAFTEKYIIDPLEMEDTYWSLDEFNLQQHSNLYADSVKMLPYYSLITYPDGGLITSIVDLSKFLQELIRGYNGKGILLNADSYKTFYEKQLDDSHYEERDADNPFNDEYDFGVFIGYSAKGYIGHTGGDPGVASFMFFEKETGMGRILFINTNIADQSGFDQFVKIWETLGEFQDRI